jgi:hypothetical protein
VQKGENGIIPLAISPGSNGIFPGIDEICVFIEIGLKLAVFRVIRPGINRIGPETVELGLESKELGLESKELGPESKELALKQ